MKRWVHLLSLFVLLAPISFAQDPLKVAPQAYKLVLENEWVKVTRVHYAPHEKIVAHYHTELAAAYVYLNDGGPVIFKHIGLDYGEITRPATKAGSYRLYKGLKEIHEVENTSDLPSDFLRVEFKTRIVDMKTLRGRYYRENWPTGENYQKIQFEDEQLRITRMVCVPGKSLDLSTNTANASVLIALSPTTIMIGGQKGKAVVNKLKLGQVKWLPVGQQTQLNNQGKVVAEILRFEFKTEPANHQNEESKTHDHLHQ